MVEDFILKPSMWGVLAYFNLVMMYFSIIAWVSGWTFSNWYALIYVAFIYIVYSWRRSRKEKEMRMIAHRIPFFADALANALAVGTTLEQAVQQSIYYLRGKLKTEFEKVMAKNALGKDLGVLLRKLDSKFPKTGLRYLTSLLEEYRDLGIGISPLLKQMAEVLKVKEGAEEKIRAILSGGSNYARLSIGIFGISFFLFAFLLKEQIEILMGPSLKPTLLFLIAWSCSGILLVTRITSLDFSNHYALRPHVKAFMAGKKWTIDDLLHYSGMRHTSRAWRMIILFSPLVFGFLSAYVVSWHNRNLYMIEISFLLGVLLSRMAIEFCLKGMVEDQLIKTIETFPDFLQIFIIGLNSGFNTFIALQFAGRAVEGMAPEILHRELFRTKSSLEYGKSHAKAWQCLSEQLPFETIIDFCEIMIISPLHGESIAKSIVQMMAGYQSKRLTLVEKKATALGQLVIPIIVIAFFPLFLFVVFAPLLKQISSLF